MKKTLLISLALLFPTYLFSQSPAWDWARSGGGSGSDEGLHVATDQSGNIYVSGLFSSTPITFGSITMNTVGSNDIFLTKYDASGNVMWAKSIGGNLSENSTDIVTDFSNNIFWAGYFYSDSITIGTTTIMNPGMFGTFLVKYDSSGNIIWVRNPVSGEGMFNKITTDNAGNIFATGGYYSSTITFGSIILTNAGGGDLFILKYDSAGNVIWGRSEGGINNDVGTGITYNAANNIFYLTGLFASPSITIGSGTLTCLGGPDILIARYDTTGTNIWAKSGGGTYQDLSRSIASDANGNVYVVGDFRSDTISFGTYILANADTTLSWDDFFIVCYSSSGTILWAQRAGAPNAADYVNKVIVDNNNNVCFTGSFFGPSVTMGASTLTNTGDCDVYIFSLNNSGNVAWALSAGGIHSDGGGGMVKDINGNLFLCGYFGSPAITFGSTTLTNTGPTASADVFLAKLMFPTDINLIENTDSMLIFFPNPATTEITINFGKASRYNVQLRNTLGEVLEQTQTNSATLSLNMSSYTKGIYFVTVRDESRVFGMVVRKVVKM